MFVGFLLAPDSFKTGRQIEVSIRIKWRNLNSGFQAVDGLFDLPLRLLDVGQIIPGCCKAWILLQAGSVSLLGYIFPACFP